MWSATFAKPSKTTVGRKNPPSAVTSRNIFGNLTKKYKYFLFSLVDSENSRTFAEILRESILKLCPFLIDFKICKLSNALAVMCLCQCVRKFLIE